jgi:hypothetical protein
VRVKPGGKSATTRPKTSPNKLSELRGWPSIAQFPGLPNSTVHRWAKVGMPVHQFIVRAETWLPVLRN